MSHPLRWIAVLFLASLSGAANAEAIEGRVVGVTDGDTITLLDADRRLHKLRLDGIDAPESGQPFGGASKRNLSDLAFNQNAIAECSKRDRYGREVCRVLVDGADVCLEQLSLGGLPLGLRLGEGQHCELCTLELSNHRAQTRSDTFVEVSLAEARQDVVIYDLFAERVW